MKTKHTSNNAALSPWQPCWLRRRVLQAAPLVYEPFDYPAGNLHGASGTSEVGLDGTWVAKVEGLHSTVVTEARFPGNMRLREVRSGPLSGGANKFGGSRPIAASALAANGLLDDGATLWLGVVMGYGPGGNVTNSRLGVALANNNFSAGNFDYWINDEGAQLGPGSVSCSGGSATSTAGWWPPSSGIWPPATASPATSREAGREAARPWALGASCPLCGQVHLGSDSGDPDTITVYQPDAALNPGAPISVSHGHFMSIRPPSTRSPSRAVMWS